MRNGALRSRAGNRMAARAPTQARHVQRSQPPGTATERATQVDKAPARRAPPASKAQTAHTRGGKLSSEFSSPDIKYVCLRARVPAIYAAKCFLRNSSVRAFASCQTGP